MTDVASASELSIADQVVGAQSGIQPLFGPQAMLPVLSPGSLRTQAPTTDAETRAEVAALDVLWEQEWDVPVDRAYAPQRIDVGELPQHTERAYAARRFLDVLVASVALLVLLPVMLLLAVAVRLTTKGPALFKQVRPGRGGTEFSVLKFRSMIDGADREVLDDDDLRQQYEDNDFKLASDDPRITRLGKFIRKTSLDELPQLINVIKGDMSIVGIRPLLPEQLACRPVEDQLLYKMMRPGLTGLWQVEGRSNVGKDDRIALDRTYVQQWSVARDVVIMARTPFALLRISDAR